MTDSLLHNPAVERLGTRVAPLKRDLADLLRLTERYMPGISLAEALAWCRRDIENLSDEYRAMKARGEAL
ncbi:MAG: hypothetical protein V1806_17390 [Pseudomonadota bacterium]